MKHSADRNEPWFKFADKPDGVNSNNSYPSGITSSSPGNKIAENKQEKRNHIKLCWTLCNFDPASYLVRLWLFILAINQEHLEIKTSYINRFTNLSSINN